MSRSEHCADAHLQHRINTQAVCQVKEVPALLANPLFQLGRGDGGSLVRFRVAGFQSTAGLHAHLARVTALNISTTTHTE